MKTPEELAEEHAFNIFAERYESLISEDKHVYDEAVDAFLAGYQAAKEHAHAALEEAEAEIDRLQTKLSDAGILTTEHLIDASKMVSSSVPLNNWISVKDRLPEDASDVLIVWADGVSEACYFDETWCRDGRRLLWVTHWMPLPAAPKEEG